MLEVGLRKSVSLVPWRYRTAIKRLPFVAPLQRWLLATYLQGSEFVHTVDVGPAAGLRYPVVLPHDKGVWTGTYEAVFAARIAAAVSPGDVCLDIGGWRGFFSGVMALAGARRVVAFEPFPENCTQIRRVIDLNPGLPIELRAEAVGADECTAEFCVMPETSMGKLATSGFQEAERGQKTIVVPVVTIDGLWKSGAIETPSVIKIDVEGAEVLVLRGARKLLSTQQPMLFLEVHSRELAAECRSFLSECGYTLEPFQFDAHSNGEISHCMARRRFQHAGSKSRA